MISEEVDGGDIGHVQDAFHFHRVRWNIRLVYGFDDSEVTLVTSSFTLLYHHSVSVSNPMGIPLDES